MENMHEIVEEADVVVLYPASETGTVDTLNIFKNVHNCHPGDPKGEITRGHVYVMNELGKTVASYHLFPPIEEQLTPEQVAANKTFDEALETHNKIAKELREERKDEN